MRSLASGKITAALACGAILLAVAPWLLNDYWLRFLTLMAIVMSLAQSFNLMLGYVGYPALGNIVFYGLGAYACAIFMNAGLSFPVAVLLGGMVCVAFTIAVGLPLLRLKGSYFLITTVALAVTTKEIMARFLSGVSGGGKGLVLPLPTGIFADYFYQTFFYTSALLTLVSTVLLVWLSRTKFGYGLQAIRSDEEVAAAAGIPTERYKVACWALSAFLGGLAGGLYAFYVGYVDVGAVFSIDYSVDLFVMTIIGGAGSVLGPLLGAAVLEIIGELAWSGFMEYHLALLGIAVILVCRFIPDGVVSLLRPGFLSSRTGTRKATALESRRAAAIDARTE